MYSWVNKYLGADHDDPILYLAITIFGRLEVLSGTYYVQETKILIQCTFSFIFTD